MNTRPVPLPDPETQPFWDAAAEGVLKVQQCQECANHVFYPRLVCPECLSEALIWKPVSGRARIYSLTVVHRAAPAFRDDLPFVVALVDLEEGPRMMTRILTENPDEPRIGDAVEVEFFPQDPGPPLPFFRVRSAAQTG